MRFRSGLLVVLLAVAACNLLQQPHRDGDVVDGDTLEPCAPKGALIPFFVDVSRDGEVDAKADLTASGQAQVTYLGDPTGARADAGYVQELRLRFYDDVREVVVAVSLPHEAPALVATLGETLSGVVARRTAADDTGAISVYVALRDLQGNLRAWLVQDANGVFADSGAIACPYGFLCPTATLADADCAPVADGCGALESPAVALRPAGTGDPVMLRQGESTVLASDVQAWTFLVSYASRYQGDSTCADRPASALAAAVLYGVAPE